MKDEGVGSGSEARLGEDGTVNETSIGFLSLTY